MKEHKFTIVIRTPMDIKNILWSFTHKLKDAFPIVSITYEDAKDADDSEIPEDPYQSQYDKIPERY